MNTIIQRSTGTVRFSFNKTIEALKENKSKEHLIYLFFSYGRQRFKYSTGYKCCFNNWDFKKQRVRNKAGILNKDEINDHLDDLERFLVKEYALLSKSKKVVSKGLLKQKLDLFTNKITASSEDATDLTFFQIIDKLIAQKEDQISIITIRSYKQTKSRLEEFENYSSNQMSFDEINMGFYNGFTKFLEKNNYSLNTIGKHIKNFKTFLNYALAEGYTTNQKFKSNNFKVKTEITTEIYLTEEEIKLMHEKDLSIYPEMEHARDVFLIGCYTGQRISDYNNLSTDDIVTIDGIDYFKIIQKKNRK